MENPLNKFYLRKALKLGVFVVLFLFENMYSVLTKFEITGGSI